MTTTERKTPGARADAASAAGPRTEHTALRIIEAVKPVLEKWTCDYPKPGSEKHEEFEIDLRHALIPVIPAQPTPAWCLRCKLAGIYSRLVDQDEGKIEDTAIFLAMLHCEDIVARTAGGTPADALARIEFLEDNLEETGSGELTDMAFKRLRKDIAAMSVEGTPSTCAGVDASKTEAVVDPVATLGRLSIEPYPDTLLFEAIASWRKGYAHANEPGISDDERDRRVDALEALEKAIQETQARTLKGIAAELGVIATFVHEVVGDEWYQGKIADCAEVLDALIGGTQGGGA